MESNAIKAITIGAGILIAIATISLVITYYNTAKEGMSSVGDGNNVYEQYERSIRDILTKTNIYGTDLTNLYNYFGDDPSIKIQIFDKTGNSVGDIKNFVRVTARPNQKFTLSVNSEYTQFNITAID